MKTDIIYNEDCLEGLSKIPDKSIDLIVIDPPYNIKKDSWDDIKNYEEWMKEVILELQRVLRDNGSFYMFHSEMEVVSDFMNFLKEQTNFIFRQFIVWNKRFEGSPRKGFLDGFVVVDNLQNYQQMAEYLLFYTKTNVEQIREYLREEKKKSKLTLLQINNLFGINISDGIAKRYFGDSQFEIPTKEKYEIMQKTGFWNKSYDEISHTFNNQKTHHSVWNYDIEKKIGHTTPKPLELVKNIILHSSKEGQIVLDCFMGSGTTALACKELNRRYIGFEKDPEYCKIISKRLSQQTLSNLSATPRTLPNGNPNGEFNKDLTAMQQVATPKSKSQRREWKW
jgi:site-specific DNA-methyltransferase (adenine-specific)